MMYIYLYIYIYIYIYIYMLESTGRATRGLDSLLSGSFQTLFRMLHIIRHCIVNAGSCCRTFGPRFGRA